VRHITKDVKHVTLKKNHLKDFFLRAKLALPNNLKNLNVMLSLFFVGTSYA